jgi:hypothetical protein
VISHHLNGNWADSFRWFEDRDVRPAAAGADRINLSSLV